MTTDPLERNVYPSPPARTDPIRVLIVADAAFVGERVREIIEAAPDLQCAGTVADGVAAVSFLRRQVVDAVVLDIGQAEARVKVTLVRMFRVDPDLKVVMVGSLSFSNVKTSMMGLMEGAAEFIPTPAEHTGKTDKEFVERLRAVLDAFGRSNRDVDAPRIPARREVAPATQPRPVPSMTPPLKLRPMSGRTPDVIAIGASTGGPQALFTVLALLPADIGVPIFITQHMPSSFTSLLADHISKHSALACAEAVDGEPVKPGRVYLAPGDYHMVVAGTPAAPIIQINQDPPVNYCRPSVDPMLDSLAALYGPAVLTVILTGMGKDGLAGCRAVVEGGGSVIAQDAETSVVWGMPGAVARAGLANQILPLDRIAPLIDQNVRVLR